MSNDFTSAARAAATPSFGMDVTRAACIDMSCSEVGQTVACAMA
jgi:hypothetical protein